MAANLPTFLYEVPRDGEVTAADWAGGMNPGGANAPGIGINTGWYDPKASDWARIADTAAHNSQAIGGNLKALEVVDYVNADINDNVAFVQTVGAVAPDGVLDATTGAVNRTGVTVPAGSWCWGTIPVA